MSTRSPPTIPLHWLLAVSSLYLLFLAYMVIVRQEILLALMVGFAAVLLYGVVRFLLAFEAIATSLRRIASQREEE